MSTSSYSNKAGFADKKMRKSVWTYAFSATQHWYSTTLYEIFSNDFYGVSGIFLSQQLLQALFLKFLLQDFLDVSEGFVHAA